MESNSEKEKHINNRGGNDGKKLGEKGSAMPKFIDVHAHIQFAAEEFTSRGEDFNYEYYKKLGGDAQVLAVGECGLDYYRLGKETEKKQEEVFRAQIDLASDLMAGRLLSRGITIKC